MQLSLVHFHLQKYECQRPNLSIVCLSLCLCLCILYRFEWEKIIIIYVALSFTIQRTMPPKFGEKWGTEILSIRTNTRFLGSLCLSCYIKDTAQIYKINTLVTFCISIGQTLLHLFPRFPLLTPLYTGHSVPPQWRLQKLPKDLIIFLSNFQLKVPTLT